MDDKLIEGQIPKDIDFSSLRTGYTTYEIEISHDDEGYYFDIYQIDRVERR